MVGNAPVETMFTKVRLWTIFLILICGANIIGSNASFALATDNNVHALTQGNCGQDGACAPLTSINKADYGAFAPAAGLPCNDDCSDHENGDACHHCHLGHCQFTVNTNSGLVPPRLFLANISATDPACFSVLLTSRKKPPRV